MEGEAKENDLRPISVRFIEPLSLGLLLADSRTKLAFSYPPNIINMTSEICLARFCYDQIVFSFPSFAGFCWAMKFLPENCSNLVYYVVRYHLYGQWKSGISRCHPQMIKAQTEVEAKIKYIMKYESFLLSFYFMIFLNVKPPMFSLHRYNVPSREEILWMACFCWCHPTSGNSIFDDQFRVKIKIFLFSF